MHRSLRKHSKARMTTMKVLELQEYHCILGSFTKTMLRKKQKFLACTRNGMCKPRTSNATLRWWRSPISLLPILKAIRMPSTVGHTSIMAIWAYRLFLIFTVIRTKVNN